MSEIGGRSRVVGWEGQGMMGGGKGKVRVGVRVGVVGMGCEGM